MMSTATLRKWLLFIAILLSGGLPWIPRLPLLGLFVVGYFMLPGNRGFDRRLLPPALLLAVIFMITILRPGGLEGLSFLIRAANFLGGLLLLNIYLKEPDGTLARDLYPILKWFSVQALATVALGSITPFLFMHISYDGPDYRTLFGLLNFHYMRGGEVESIRPDGFFWEPGVLQAYLNIHLILALFIFRNWRQAVLAAFAVISTRSTTGVMILAMICGSYFLQRLQIRNMRNLVASVVLGAALLVPIGFIAADNIQDKFTGEGRGSFWARQYDLFTGLNVLRANWLVGIGFDYDTYTNAARTLGYSESPLAVVGGSGVQDRQNTNGIVFLFYSLGIPLALPFLIGMFRQRLLPHRWLIGILLFLSLFSETYVFTPLPLCLMFSGLVGRWKLNMARSQRLPQEQRAG